MDGANHPAAGPGLLQELLAYEGCAPGDAVLTGGHRLPARYVIHAVGQVWHGGARGEPAVLRQAYRSAFARAREPGDVRSIAFPAISTGVYGYPKRAAAEIALGVMQEEAAGLERIVACLFDDESVRLYRELLGAG